MAALSLLPAALAFALTAAHGLRLGDMGLFAACLGCAGLLFSRRAFVRLAAIPLLCGAALFWAHTALELAALRRAFGEPWLRMGLILGAVAALCLVAAWLMTTASAKKRFPRGADTAALQAAAFTLTMAILELARAKAGIPILLADRFFPGFGHLEILALIVFSLGWGFLYGGLMNLWEWPFIAGPQAQSWATGMSLADSLQRYAAYYLVTSLAWDLAGAAGNLLLMLAFGAPALRALKRFRQRFAFVYQRPVETEGQPAAQAALRQGA